MATSGAYHRLPAAGLALVLGCGPGVGDDDVGAADDDTTPADDDTSPDDDTGHTDDDTAADDDIIPDDDTAADDDTLPDDDTGSVDDDTISDDDTAADDDTIPDDDSAADDDSTPADDDTAFVDADGDGYPSDTDCDDADPEVHPGGPETCDGVDEDCDGLVDQEPSDGETWYADADGDGYGDPSAPVVVCGPFPGVVEDATDCDDTSNAVHPGAVGICDGVDEDCDGRDECPLDGIVDLSTAGGRIDSTESDAGYSLSGAGDVNGDGYDDIILGNPTGTARGLAYIFFGPVMGHFDVSDADVRLESDGAVGGYFGWSVSGGGDLDGDGYDDVVVGAPAYYDGADGRVYAFFGPLAGTVLASDADSRIETSDFDALGHGVVIVEDVTGDGRDDLWCSRPDALTLVENATLLFAGPLGAYLDQTDAVGWVTPGIDMIGGYDVSATGDVNGDGTGDLLFGGSSHGAKSIDGGLTGPTTGDSALATFRTEAGLGGISFLRVAGAGDVDGNGLGDVLMADISYSDVFTHQGAAYLFLGPLAGEYDGGTADIKLVGETEYSYAGWDVSGAGDVDGDGLPDYLVGAPGHPTAPDVGGSVYLFYGPGPTGEHSLADADARLDSPGDAVGAGWAVAAAGDLDADGYDDIITTTALGAAASPIDSTVFVVYGRPR